MTARDGNPQENPSGGRDKNKLFLGNSCRMPNGILVVDQIQGISMIGGFECESKVIGTWSNSFDIGMELGSLSLYYTF